VALLLALASAQSAQAIDLSALYDNTGAPTAFGVKVLEAFQGKDFKGKDGPMSRIGMDLIVVFQEFEDFQARGGRQALGRPFKPSDPLIRTYEEAVVIDAVAANDAEALRQDLVALGLQQASVFGHMVSGYLPITALRDAAALGTLRLARPAAAMTLAGAVTSQGDGLCARTSPGQRSVWTAAASWWARCRTAITAKEAPRATWRAATCRRV
jgi:hypothetical protein